MECCIILLLSTNGPDLTILKALISFSIAWLCLPVCNGNYVHQLFYYGDLLDCVKISLIKAIQKQIKVYIFKLENWKGNKSISYPLKFW